MQSDPHIRPEVLVQFASGETSAFQIATLVRHLEHCDTCAETYVRLCLSSRPLKVVVPETVWPRIQSGLSARQAKCANSRWFRLPAGFRTLAFAGMVALLLLSAALLIWRQNLRNPTLNIGQYLAVLEKSNAGPSAENLNTLFPSFTAYDRGEALRETNVRAEVENYRLVEQRTWHSQDRVVQLIYASDHDVVALFIAPRTANVDFKQYHLAAIELNGIRCRRVVCPRQDVFWTTSGARQYVFIRRHSDSGDSGRLFTALVRPTP